MDGIVQKADDGGVLEGDRKLTVVQWQIVFLSVFLMALGLLCVAECIDAQASPPDFEWISPIMLPQINEETYFARAVVDPVSGDVYCFVENYTFDMPYDLRLWCFHYNQSTMGFELVGFNRITNSTGLWDCYVYDGRVYLFYSGRSSYLRLKIDGRDVDELSIVIPEHSNFNVLGFYGGSIHIELLFSRDQSYYYDIVSIDPVSLAWTRTPFFNVLQNKTVFIGMPTWSILRNGKCYCPYLVDNTSEHNSSLTTQLWLWSCDLDAPRPGNPIVLLKGAHATYWGDRIDIDSNGDIHLFDRWSKLLLKFSPQGELLGEMPVSPLSLDGAIWDYTTVIVNQSGNVFILGEFRSNHTQVVDDFLCAEIGPDYDSSPTFSTVDELGPIGFFWSFIRGPHTVHVVLRTTVDGINRYSLTYQIEPSPDLMVMPGSFKFEDRPGAATPDELSFEVSNIGHAPSERHHMKIEALPQNATDWISIGDILYEGALVPLGSIQFRLEVLLPRGTYRLGIELHHVVPFENIRSNNRLEVWVYVQNHPPELVVTEPVNGKSTSDSIRATGKVSDLDGDENILVVIDGLPCPAKEIPTHGEWTLDIDLAGIPSGDYLLTFVAFDGISYSEMISRWIRIDRAEDRLALVFSWPEGDVDMLLGEQQVFLVQVTERFYRELRYNWTLDGSVVRDGNSVFNFTADEVGSFSLAVEASSNLATLSHSWAIHVRHPIDPWLLAISPGSPIPVSKRTVSRFSVTIENPDNVACDLVWLYDGRIYDRSGLTECDVRLEEGGDHIVSAMLLWSGGHSEVSWNVTVLNMAPRLLSWSPNASVKVLEDTMLMLSVSADDPDGDELSYRWESTNLTIEPIGTGTLRVFCPYIPGLNRTVCVIVTDGEDSSAMEWSIESPAGNGPGGAEPSKNPADTSWLLLALVLAVACAISVGYYMGMRRMHGRGPG